MDPKAARTLLAARAEQRPARDLSERERDVLALVGAGLANKQIGRRIDISEKTVKAHLTRVFRSAGRSYDQCPLSSSTWSLARSGC
jgi:DNA-binding NarL/FixJ family response regulator